MKSSFAAFICVSPMLFSLPASLQTFLSFCFVQNSSGIITFISFLRAAKSCVFNLYKYSLSKCYNKGMQSVFVVLLLLLLF